MSSARRVEYRIKVSLLTFGTALVFGFGLGRPVYADENGCTTTGDMGHSVTSCSNTSSSSASDGGSASSSSSSSISVDSSSTSTSQSSSSTSITSGKYDLNQYSGYKSTDGKTLELQKRDVVMFTLGDRTYAITIDDVTPEQLHFSVTPRAIDATVSAGQTIDIDANGDGRRETAVTYQRMSGTAVLATFRSLDVQKVDELAVAPSTYRSPLPLWVQVAIGLVSVALLGSAAFILRRWRLKRNPSQR